MKQMLSKQLQDQIEQEAKHKGKNHMFIPMDGNYSSYEFHGFIVERSYLSAATKYAALYETALARAERAEKALKDFADRLNEHCTRQGIYSAGIHKIHDEMKAFTLTPKTGEDELHKES